MSFEQNFLEWYLLEEEREPVEDTQALQSAPLCNSAVSAVMTLSPNNGEPNDMNSFHLETANLDFPFHLVIKSPSYTIELKEPGLGLTVETREKSSHRAEASLEYERSFDFSNHESNLAAARHQDQLSQSITEVSAIHNGDPSGSASESPVASPAPVRITTSSEPSRENTGSPVPSRSRSASPNSSRESMSSRIKSSANKMMTKLFHCSASQSSQELVPENSTVNQSHTPSDATPLNSLTEPFADKSSQLSSVDKMNLSLSTNQEISAKNLSNTMPSNSKNEISESEQLSLSSAAKNKIPEKKFSEQSRNTSTPISKSEISKSPSTSISPTEKGMKDLRKNPHKGPIKKKNKKLKDKSRKTSTPIGKNKNSEMLSLSVSSLAKPDDGLDKPSDSCGEENISEKLSSTNNPISEKNSANVSRSPSVSKAEISGSFSNSKLLEQNVSDSHVHNISGSANNEEASKSKSLTMQSSLENSNISVKSSGKKSDISGKQSLYLSPRSCKKRNISKKSQNLSPSLKKNKISQKHSKNMSTPISQTDISESSSFKSITPGSNSSNNNQKNTAFSNEEIMYAIVSKDEISQEHPLSTSTPSSKNENFRRNSNGDFTAMKNIASDRSHDISSTSENDAIISNVLSQSNSDSSAILIDQNVNKVEKTLSTKKQLSNFKIEKSTKIALDACDKILEEQQMLRNRANLASMTKQRIKDFGKKQDTKMQQDSEKQLSIKVPQQQDINNRNIELVKRCSEMDTRIRVIKNSMEVLIKRCAKLTGTQKDLTKIPLVVPADIILPHADNIPTQLSVRNQRKRRIIASKKTGELKTDWLKYQTGKPSRDRYGTVDEVAERLFSKRQLIRPRWLGYSLNQETSKALLEGKASQRQVLDNRSLLRMATLIGDSPTLMNERLTEPFGLSGKSINGLPAFRNYVASRLHHLLDQERNPGEKLITNRKTQKINPFVANLIEILEKLIINEIDLNSNIQDLHEAYMRFRTDPIVGERAKKKLEKKQMQLKAKQAEIHSIETQIKEFNRKEILGAPNEPPSEPVHSKQLEPLARNGLEYRIKLKKLDKAIDRRWAQRVPSRDFSWRRK